MENIKPNFLIIGAPKAATTTLASMFLQHPQACIAEWKEPHFFSMDKEYTKGWAWYLTHFRHCKGKLAIGDASTSYSRIRSFPHTAQRIHFHIPDVKIIYMVRHPLERIVSAYVEWQVLLDKEHTFPPFNQAVRTIPTIVDSSRYWEVFNYYRHYFDEDHIKIVWFEEFIADPTGGFQDVCRFLDIDDAVLVQADKKHQNSREQIFSHLAQKHPDKPPQLDLEWTAETKRWVLDQISEDIRRFLDNFDKPPDYWGDLRD